MSENQEGMRRAMREAAARGDRSKAFDPLPPLGRLDITNAQLVARVGRALYGQEWQSPLARDLQVQLRTMQRIAAASVAGQEYPSAGALIGSLEIVVYQRRGELHDLQRELNARNETPPLP